MREILYLSGRVVAQFHQFLDRQALRVNGVDEMLVLEQEHEVEERHSYQHGICVSTSPQPDERMRDTQPTNWINEDHKNCEREVHSVGIRVT